MDEALLQVGLPVVCRKCLTPGRVCPGTDYNGWYKSKVFTTWRICWWCPEHYVMGVGVDKKAFENHGKVEPIALVYSEAADHKPDELEELLSLID